MTDKLEHDFQSPFGRCAGCGLHVEQCIDLRYCPGEKFKLLSPEEKTVYLKRLKP